MTLYQINSQIRAILDGAVDEETGELKDISFEELDKLMDDRNTKIQHCGMYYLERKAEIKALKEIEDKAKARRQALERKNENLADYVRFNLDGEKFECPEFRVTYRNSESVELDECFIAWAQKRCKKLLRVKPEADKTAIKELLKAGKKVPHATLITKTSMTIK